jgi:hypothetical protein
MTKPTLRYKRSGHGYVILGQHPSIIGFVRKEYLAGVGYAWHAFLPPMRDTFARFGTRRAAAEWLLTPAAQLELDGGSSAHPTRWLCNADCGCEVRVRGECRNCGGNHETEER